MSKLQQPGGISMEQSTHSALFSMLEVEVVMMMMVWHNLAVVVNMAMLGKYSSSSCNSVWSGQDFKENDDVF